MARRHHLWPRGASSTARRRCLGHTTRRRRCHRQRGPRRATWTRRCPGEAGARCTTPPRPDRRRRPGQTGTVARRFAQPAARIPGWSRSRRARPSWRTSRQGSTLPPSRRPAPLATQTPEGTRSQGGRTLPADRRCSTCRLGRASPPCASLPRRLGHRPTAPARSRRTARTRHRHPQTPARTPRSRRWWGRCNRSKTRHRQPAQATCCRRRSSTRARTGRRTQRWTAQRSHRTRRGGTPASSASSQATCSSGRPRTPSPRRSRRCTCHGAGSRRRRRRCSQTRSRRGRGRRRGCLTPSTAPLRTQTESTAHTRSSCRRARGTARYRKPRNLRGRRRCSSPPGRWTAWTCRHPRPQQGRTPTHRARRSMRHGSLRRRARCRGSWRSDTLRRTAPRSRARTPSCRGTRTW